MREVTPENAADYLRETGRVPAGRDVAARALGWGVSNVVIRVDVEGQAPLVLKQAREQLRTKALWVSRLDRIWTERAALELLAGLLPRGTVPEVVFADEPDYLLAMTCAPDDADVWKRKLLAGPPDAGDYETARRAGEILGTIHAETADHPALAGRLADTQVFDELRIDPFYRTVARVHADLAPQLDRLIASMESAPERTFVHADFSPKNILVHAAGLTLVDFETAHAGDPAFDLGFFLSHLLLKAFRAAQRGSPDPYLHLIGRFWESYLARTRIDPGGERIQRTAHHAAACALARVDGKSPVDYLDDRAREAVRRFARDAMWEDALSWERLVGSAAREMLVKDVFDTSPAQFGEPPA
jgi:5-methylthioribose kinase